MLFFFKSLTVITESMGVILLIRTTGVAPYTQKTSFNAFIACL